MTFEEALAAALDAKLAPLVAELTGLRREVESLRRALPPMLVPLKVAARRMGVSVKTARRRAESGSWPTRREAGKIYVDLAGLRAPSEGEVAAEVQRLRATNPIS